MALVAWPVNDPGLRTAAAIADTARAHGYHVCTIGAEALSAYTAPGTEFRGRAQPCDVLITIGTWRPLGYEQTRARMRYHREVGAVRVDAVIDVSRLMPRADPHPVSTEAYRTPRVEQPTSVAISGRDRRPPCRVSMRARL
jgi:hypothetical protein